MADKMLREQHHDVGNNGEKTLPKGFCPDYFHRLRFIRENSDFYIQQDNIEKFSTLSWYSKKVENYANRFQSVRETKDIMENLIYRNSVSGICAEDAKGVFSKRKTVEFETSRPDNLKTWTAYGNFDKNHKKLVVETCKAADNESMRCSYDTRSDADVQISSSTETHNAKQLVNEAAVELKDAGKKAKKIDKGRPNFLTTLWRRITRKPNKKTSAEKENKVNATVKKQSRFSSFLCRRQPKTIV